LVLRFLSATFGQSEIVTRSPSAFFGVLTLCVAAILPGSSSSSRGSRLAFLLLLAFYMYEHPSFVYRLKFGLYTVLVSLVMVICLPIVALRPRNPKNFLWTQPFFPPISRLLGLQWEVRGTENLSKDVACVFICNHQSILDILGMYEIWPMVKRGVPVSKKEILYVFPFGLVAWLCGTVFIDRSNSTQSRTQITQSAEALKRARTKLWIFPEGTRYKGPSLLPFKKGAFHIALQNKVPIQPVLISPYTFIDDKHEHFGSGKMIISVMPQIETDGLCLENLNEFIEETRGRMVEEFEGLAQAVQKSNGVS